MNTFFRFKSLRTRLAFWFLLVTMLCLLAVVTTLYLQRAEIIRGREFEKLEIVRDLKVRDLDKWLEERMGDLQMISRYDEIRSLEKILSNKKDEWTAEDLKAISKARALMLRYLRTYTAYHEVFLIEASSGRTVIQANPSLEGRDKREFPYFIEPMRTRKPFIQDIYHLDVEQKPAMAFAAPVFCLDHDGEHLVGVLVMRNNLEQSLYPLLQDRTGAGETGETLIVNKDGFAVNALRWHESAPLKLKINAAPAVRAVGGETGIVESKDYRGEMVLAAYTHIPLMGWGFVAKRDLAEIYAPIDAMLRQMVILVVVSLLVVLLVSFFLSKTIADPLAGISAIVRRFSEGDLEARCAIAGVDEMATLGTLFNGMAATFASQMTIQQRTSEVTDTMVAVDEMEKFAPGLLMKFIDISGSHLGAFYLRGEDGQTLEPIASVGLSDDSAASFSAEDHEGELGQALATGKVACLRDISPDTAFTFKTTSGTAVPREIMTIPLIVDERVMAVVSLATLSAYSDTHREIIDRAHVGMNIALSSLMANQKTRGLARELMGRNEELEAQAQEMEEQATELRSQAVELEAQRLQVEEANRLKSEFLSNMSHELRTPLNSVITLSELMSSRGAGKDPEKDAEYLRIIQQNGYHLLNLINDILDISKIEAGRMDVSLSDFQADHPLGRALDTARPLAAKKGLGLDVQAQDVPAMHSDEDKVYQILLNLVSNAVKFTKKGSIDVTVSTSDERVVYAVKDTGLGIAPSDLGRIFGEFRQVDGSTTRQYEGTGLGLAICQRLAHLLGGEIGVVSTPGEGSTFSLVLPVRSLELASGAPVPQLRPTPNLAKPLSGPKPPTGRTILVVDDEPAVCEMLQGFFEESGYDVVTAHSGADALRLAKDLHPFAITLDVLMPEMDGWEVLTKLKASEVTANIPVIMVSVSPDTETGRALGATAFVVKPVTKELLLAEIGKLSCWRTVRNILVVDDDATVREYLSFILEERGYRVVAVPGGKEALESVSSYRPDAVVLDLMMPEVDGFTVLDKLREDPATHDLPVIVVTAKDLTPEEQRRLADTTQRVIGKGVMEKEDLHHELDATLVELGQQALQQGAKEKPRVLVVEDNEINALQVRTALEENGFEVSVAIGGEEALASFSQVLPDAVVLDLMMPKIDGFEVLEHIRSTPWTCKLPVLVLTAKELTCEDRARLAYNNVHELIQKGALQRDELVARVWGLLEKSDASVAPMPPQTPPKEAAPPPPDAETTQAAPRGERTVLVVEDNPDNMFTITELLDEMGYAYVKAMDGAQGVEMAKKIRPALILMDIQLPGLSGIDATRQIRETEGISQTPIIAMTAKAMKGDKEEILAAGCDAYASKPLAAEEVMELIRKWLR